MPHGHEERLCEHVVAAVEERAHNLGERHRLVGEKEGGIVGVIESGVFVIVVVDIGFAQSLLQRAEEIGLRRRHRAVETESAGSGEHIAVDVEIAVLGEAHNFGIGSGKNIGGIGKNAVVHHVEIDIGRDSFCAEHLGISHLDTQVERVVFVVERIHPGAIVERKVLHHPGGDNAHHRTFVGGEENRTLHLADTARLECVNDFDDDIGLPLDVFRAESGVATATHHDRAFETVFLEFTHEFHLGFESEIAAENGKSGCRSERFHRGSRDLGNSGVAAGDFDAIRDSHHADTERSGAQSGVGRKFEDTLLHSGSESRERGKQEYKIKE